MRRLTILMFAIIVATAGCGDEPDEIPNAEPGDLESQQIDWVVDGMSCQGAEVTRMVSLVDDDPGRAEYRRGDECVEPGDTFWEEMPSTGGDDVEILVDPEGDDYVEFSAQTAGDYAIRLEGDEHDDLLMRQAHPDESATQIPDLSDFELGGQWWMEGYPCAEEQVPQVASILHDGTFLEMSKVVGDDCLGDGERFVEAGEVQGTSISGEALLEESDDDFPIGNGDDEGDSDDDEVDWSQASGTVYTEDHIRLDVAGAAVNLRRVMADPDE